MVSFEQHEAILRSDSVAQEPRLSLSGVKSVRDRANEDNLVAQGRPKDQHEIVMVGKSVRHDAFVAENQSRIRSQEHSAAMAFREVARRRIQSLEDEHRRRQEELMKSKQEVHGSLKVVEPEPRAKQRAMVRKLAAQKFQAERNDEDLQRTSKTLMGQLAAL